MKRYQVCQKSGPSICGLPAVAAWAVFDISGTGLVELVFGLRRTRYVNPPPRSILRQDGPRFNVPGLEQDNPWCKWIIAWYVRCSPIDHAFDIYPPCIRTVIHGPNHITMLITRSLSPPWSKHFGGHVGKVRVWVCVAWSWSHEGHVYYVQRNWVSIFNLRLLWPQALDFWPSERWCLSHSRCVLWRIRLVEALWR